MQQYCIKWNNHMRNFQLTLPKYFQAQKFLDCTLLVEGKHLVPCHKFVLDACSDYFASFLKNKILDDKNLVICLPKEIKLWEIQALLQFMYHGEVCISQEGLASLVKCAELLQVKGLCGNETTSIISKGKDTSSQPKNKVNHETNGDIQQNGIEDATAETSNSNQGPEMVEMGANEGESVFDDQMIIKKEVNISDFDSSNMDDDQNSDRGQDSATENLNSQSMGLIRVKRNLFEQDPLNIESKRTKADACETSTSLVYNKKAMDISVQQQSSKETDDIDETSSSSTPLLIEHDQEFENIVCSPNLMQYNYMGGNIKKAPSQIDISSPNKPDQMDDFDDDDDDDLFIEEANVCSNDVLYNMITEKFGDCDTFSTGNDHDSELKRKIMISSVGSLNHQYRGNEGSSDGQGMDQNNEMKMAIGGLYLRNPRGNQIRQYDVNALYNALQDVKNGHSIYRAAQTYSIPRKTLRNWMKRLHIKSQFPMPKQLKQAAERKKNSQKIDERGSNIIMNTIELS